MRNRSLIEQKQSGRRRCFPCKQIESIHCGGVGAGVLVDGSDEEDFTTSVSAFTFGSGRLFGIIEAASIELCHPAKNKLMIISKNDLIRMRI